MDPREDQKRAAAQAAALLVQDGMKVGLGTGTTVAHFLPALARRELDITCVATSPETERSARALGLSVQAFDMLDRLDVAVDGADQVAPDLWLVKGGGGAHTREKVVAAAADRFVVIVSEDKLVDAIGPPVPLEVLRFGLASTLRRLNEIGPVTVRDAPPTPDGNAIVDFMGAVTDPATLVTTLRDVPGVIDHGLFEPRFVSEVFVGRRDGRVNQLPGTKQAMSG
jgi:ribose 5-phosphate isomerase A